MHDTSLDAMGKMLLRLDTWAGKSVLDIGSRDINGSYRGMVNLLGAKYTGLDIVAGKNVDVVATEPYHYPFEYETFDAVICGGMLHCVARPWLLLPEMVRVLNPGGLLAITTVFVWGLNSYPVDYYRYTDNGLRVLFDETHCLTNYELTMLECDVYGSAFKV